MIEYPDFEAGIGNDELDPIVLASFCGLAVVVKVVNIDYHPDFFGLSLFGVGGSVRW